MTDYLAEATRYIREQYGDQVSVLQDHIVDSDRFYCFTFQSNEFIRTGDFSAMAVGQGYTIISKADNRLFEFGSRHSLDESLKILEENLRTEEMIRTYKPQFDLGTSYGLQINRVKKPEVLIEKLRQHGVTYIIPEVVGDSIFRIPKTYDSKRLQKRLDDLPVVFHGVSNTLNLIRDIIVFDCCEFDLLKHPGRSFAKHVDRATEEDLRPIW